MKKYIGLLLLCILLTGCGGDKITGTYKKILSNINEGIPQIMQYTIKDDQLKEYVSTTYTKTADELEVYLNRQYEDFLEKFGEDAITTNTSFDDTEQLYVGTVTIDYNKINDKILDAYIEKNDLTKESLITVEGIYSFSEYENLTP